LTWRELREILDEELARLPDKYRAPLLLCYFEGMTQEEAARQLGWSKRSVKDRLERGRNRLRACLARRGVTLPRALASPMLAEAAAGAVAPTSLTEATLRAAVPFARCRPPGDGGSVRALALAEGGLKTMFAGKLHVLAAGLLAVALLGSAGLLVGHTPQDTAPAQRDGKDGVDRYGDPLPRGAVTRLGTVRYRHGGSGTAFLTDGKTVVSVGNSIAFWDARTGRLLRTIDTGNLSLGEASAFSQGAKRLAVSGSLSADDKPGWRNVVRVFDTSTGKELRTFERDPRDGAHALALSPDGKFLFCLGREGKLRIEEVATGVELLRQKFPGDVGASLALSPDGSTVALASGPNTRKLFLWKWQEAQEPRELKTPRYRGHTLAFSPDGKVLADCSDSGATLRIWDVKSGQLLHKLQSPDRDIYWYNHAVFAPDGKSLAVSGSSNRRGMLHLWEPVKGKFLKRLDVGGGALAFSADGTLLAAGSRVWDFAASKELSANDEAHRDAVERVVTGPGGVVVTAASDNTIRIWDAATGKQQRRLAHDGWIRDIALSPDGSRLVSNSLDDTVCLWDVATGRKVYRLAGHGQLGGRRAVVFSPDGKSFLAWGDDMYLRQWDVRTGKAVFEHALRPTGIEVPGEDGEADKRERLSFTLGDGRFSPDGKHFILQAGSSFFVFDTATGKELRKFPCETGHVIAMTVSPGGQLLTSAWGKPIETRLPGGGTQYSSPKHHPATWWDLATGKRSNQILLPEQGAGPVAFAPSGRLFAVASSRPGSRIRLVEVASGREVRKIEGFRGVVRSLAFLPDGKRLVAGMEDSSALIWDLTR
jgi:WD40 repeat protein